MPIKKQDRKGAQAKPGKRKKANDRAGETLRGATRSTVATGVSPWKTHLDMYEDIRALRFATLGDFARASEILWSDDLRDCPCDLAPHNTIMVPAEAVAYFKDLKFTESPVLSADDLPPDELDELRREQGPY